MGIYRLLKQPSHPLAHRGWVHEHRALLYDRIGPGIHPCHWCQAPVEWRHGMGNSKGSLVTDHVNGIQRDNRPENLVPACHRCNTLRARTGHEIRPDEAFITRSDGAKARAYQRNCARCGETFFVVRSAMNNRPTRGRFCSIRCGKLGSTHVRRKSARLTDEQVREVRRRATAKEPQSRIAADYGITQQMVSMIHRRLTYQSTKD